jgi:hypothetical protein
MCLIWRGYIFIWNPDHLDRIWQNCTDMVQTCLYLVHTNTFQHERVCTCTCIYINVCSTYIHVCKLSYVCTLYIHVHDCKYVHVHCTDTSVQLHNHTSLPIMPNQPCDASESQVRAGISVLATKSYWDTC